MALSSSSGRFRSLLVAMVVATALIAVSCGSTTSERGGSAAALSSQPAAALFNQLSPDMSQAGSASFEATMEITPGPEADITTPVVLDASGAFDLTDGSFSVVTDLSGLADAVPTDQGMPADLSLLFADPIELRVVDDVAYVHAPIVESFTGSSWVEVSRHDVNQLDEVEQLPDLLAELEQADATVEEVGTEEIRGTATTHYRVTPDQSEAASSDLGERPTIDLWIDDDGLARRAHLDLDAADLDDESGEVERVVLTVDLFDYGVDPAIVAPDEADVVTLGDLGLGRARPPHLGKT